MSDCRSGLYLLLILALAGCASAPQSEALLEQRPSQLAESRIIEGVPFYAQELYQCGPAALATILQFSEIEVSPDELVPLVYLPERKGSLQIEMVAAARSYGRLTYEISPDMETLLGEIAAGSPVLVMQNLALSIYPRWHYAVVKGYDFSRQEVLLNSGINEDYWLDFKVFERTWSRADHWGILALEPGTMPVSADASQYFRALADLEPFSYVEALEDAYLSGLKRWPTDQNLLMGYGNLLYTMERLKESANQYQQVTKP